MDVSIIIPCKNTQDYIKPLLLTLHMVNFNNIEYEILFVMDSEEDKTAEVIEHYMSDMSYKILYSKTTYVGMARNCGLDNATGEFIWFVDSDDWIINPDVIQQLIGAMHETTDPIIQLKFVSNYFNIQHYSMVWQYFFRRDFLEDLRFSNIQYQEDNDFMQRALQKFGTTKLNYLSIPSYFYNYRRPGSNTSIQWGTDR